MYNLSNLLESNFSETLSELMSMRNLNAEELSEKITVDRSTITRYLEGKTIPMLPNAIEIADYFGCSLDYLFCLTNEFNEKKYSACPPFYQAFQEILKIRKCTRYRLGKDNKFPNNTLVDWFYGRRLPRIDNVIKIANYFGCTLDEIVGRKSIE